MGGGAYSCFDWQGCGFSEWQPIPAIQQHQRLSIQGLEPGPSALRPALLYSEARLPLTFQHLIDV